MSDKNEVWAMVEILGHVRRVGRVSEVTRYGTEGVLVQVPRADGSFEPDQFYAGRALFAVHHMTETEARRAAGFGSAAALPGRRLDDDTDPDEDDDPTDATASQGLS